MAGSRSAARSPRSAASPPREGRTAVGRRDAPPNGSFLQTEFLLSCKCLYVHTGDRKAGAAAAAGADRFAAAASAGPLKTNALEQKPSAPRKRPLRAPPWARLPEAEAEWSLQALAPGRCTPASVSPSAQGGIDKRSAQCQLLAGILFSRHRGRQRRAGQTRGLLLGSLPFR